MAARPWAKRRQGNDQASELLGLNRATLRHKLRTLGLAVDTVLIEDHQQKNGK
jgi:hypothetical protein